MLFLSIIALSTSRDVVSHAKNRLLLEASGRTGGRDGADHTTLIAAPTVTHPAPPPAPPPPPTPTPPHSPRTQVDTHKGFTSAHADELRKTWGWNELPEKKKNVILLFLSYFWGPMPVMIWVAIIIELVKGILTGEGWEDFAVLMVLQFANAIVGFVEENNAGNAIDVRFDHLPAAFFIFAEFLTQPRPPTSLPAPLDSSGAEKRAETHRLRLA